MFAGWGPELRPGASPEISHRGTTGHNQTQAILQEVAESAEKIHEVNSSLCFLCELL